MFSQLFTTKLYDHVFDIDDLLAALCNVPPAGWAHAQAPARWVMSTRSGSFTAEAPGAEDAALVDGGDTNHLHLITPLAGSAALLRGFMGHPAAGRLAEEARNALDSAIVEGTPLATLWAELESNPAGPFLYARLKEIALVWLNDRGLIPPSMRHVRAGAFDPEELFTPPLPSAGTRIKFEG